MKVIREHKLVGISYQLVSMPEGSRILGVGVRGDDPILWMLETSQATITTRTVHLVESDKMIADDLIERSTYVGSITLGGAVLHVLVEKER